MKQLLLGLFILSVSFQSCGDKKKNTPPPPEEPPKQEVVVMDTTPPEPIIEEEIIEVPQERSVAVQEGEWLYDISRREYGNAQSWKKIYEANKEIIDNPDLIFPGQELIIPE